MESMMAGTPTIATVVGGLQDQMGFKVDGREFKVQDLTAEIPSNSTGGISGVHGEWVYPLWPNHSMQGSPMTPYIYDSRPTIKDIEKGLKYWYDMSKEERSKRGLAGREWAIKNGFTHKDMCNGYIKSIDKCFETFEPRTPFVLMNTNGNNIKYDRGILI